MADEHLSTEQLLQENQRLRQRVSELESSHDNEQYHDIFQYAGDSIFILDPGTKEILDANNHAVRRFGYSYEELREVSLKALEVSEKEAQKLSTGISWRSVISDTFVYETVYLHKNGTQIPVEVSSRQVKKGDKYIRINFVRDITERIKIVEQQKELELERERVGILAKFISQISHEFKTPLAIIETNTYLLEKKGASEITLPHINQISYQVANITQLVDDLLTMSKLDSGQSMPFDKVHVNELLQVVNGAIPPQAEAKELHIQMALTEERLWISAHAEYLQHAFMHIIDNAVRYTPAGGEIFIRSELMQDHAVIEIEDNGSGISRASLPRVLERFYREDHAGTTRGFGMGLPIADSIIKRHYGRLEIKSEEGVGTLVRIILPVQTT